MPDTAAIEIPRHPDEGSRAYAARVAYVTMGPGRSIDKVGQQLGYKSATPPGHIIRWSQEHGWVESARQYDEAVAYLTVQEAAAAYRRDLEEHRTRYQQSGRALHGVAVDMLRRLRDSATGIEYTPAALATIARALTVAAEMEAHALRVESLLPSVKDTDDTQTDETVKPAIVVEVRRDYTTTTRAIRQTESHSS